MIGSIDINDFMADTSRLMETVEMHAMESQTKEFIDGDWDFTTDICIRIWYFINISLIVNYGEFYSKVMKAWFNERFPNFAIKFSLQFNSFFPPVARLMIIFALNHHNASNHRNQVKARRNLLAVIVILHSAINHLTPTCHELSWKFLHIPPVHSCRAASQIDEKMFVANHRRRCPLSLTHVIKLPVECIRNFHSPCTQ